jgi:hypothetical protein
MRGVMARRHVIPLLAIAGAFALPVSTPAVVPPKDCGRMTVAGKRIQVKVDQITCKSGKRYASRYVRRRSKPRGYTCRRYASRKGRVLFYCNNGRKIFFAIRR